VRALFLLLLLANLLLLAWSTWIAPPVALAGTATPSATDRDAIRLISEPPRAAGATRTSAAARSPLDLGGVTCVSAGPFLEQAQAEAVLAQLQRLGFTSRLRPSRDEVRVGHWVLVADLATAEDAANAVVALRAAGLGDAEVVKEDPPRNVVSIGVYAEASGAAEAVEIARKTGFTAQESDRTGPADVVWLDIDRHDNGGLPPMDLLGAGRSEAMPPLEMRPCPATATPAG
jgi:hypothetical protein